MLLFMEGQNQYRAHCIGTETFVDSSTRSLIPRPAERSGGLPQKDRPG